MYIILMIRLMFQLNTRQFFERHLNVRNRTPEPPLEIHLKICVMIRDHECDEDLSVPR